MMMTLGLSYHTKGNGFTTNWKLAVNELENRKKPRTELPDQSEKRGLLNFENSTLGSICKCRIGNFLLI